jgi:hypothetical protein
MKPLVTAIVVTAFLLPVHSWGQRSPTSLVRQTTVKSESKQARYARLDQYAQHLPETQAATLEKLAASLASQARTDDDKARLIFSWLAYHITYDATLSDSDTTHYYRRCIPSYVLQHRKAICQGYADLFTELATRLKLPAHTITGHGHTSSDTGNLLDVANGHSWNAYRLAGTWHFADATWAAGGTLIGTNEFKQQFAPFWFDTPPAQLIFTHLPDSAAWQLLPILVTPTLFQNWPYVEPTWFQLVSGESMRKALATSLNPASSFPIIQANTHHVTLIQIPKSGKLVANQPVKFVFSVPNGVEMFVVTDSSRVPLQAAGSYWQTTVTPVAGDIWVEVQKKDDYTTAVNLLKYTIVPAPLPTRQVSRHRAVAPNKVVYLYP